MWCFVPSAFFGLDFRLDQSKQGTRGSFFCSEMSLGELNLSHVALASAWVLVRYHADGWGGILALTLDRSEYHDPPAPSAYGGATSDALDLGIHSACRRTVVESWSQIKLGESR